MHFALALVRGTMDVGYLVEQTLIFIGVVIVLGGGVMIVIVFLI